MKSALSLTLAVSLVASPLPVTAQELAHATAREAVRLAASTGEPTMSVTENVQQGGKSRQSDWSRVRKLAPGTEVILTTEGSAPGRRYFVSADDSSLTVLNLTDSSLPAATARALREIASQHREYFEGAARGGTYLVDNLRLASAGVFVADRKIADLQRVVQTSARKEISRIETRRKGRGVWGHLGPLGGYFVGAMSGGYAAGLACQAAVGRDRCDTGAFLTGALVGGIAGVSYGLLAANRETQEIVYLAP